MIGRKQFTVFDPVFNQEIRVFLNCNDEDWEKFQRRMGVKEIDGLDPNTVAFATHISSEDEPTTYVIWVNRFNWTLDCQESLIHEIVHIVVRIWQANNIQFVPETQEFFAHTVGRLYNLIGAKIHAKPRKKKK